MVVILQYIHINTKSSCYTPETNMKMKVKVVQSCLTLCDPMDCIVHIHVYIYICSLLRGGMQWWAGGQSEETILAESHDVYLKSLIMSHADLPSSGPDKPGPNQNQ